MNQLALIGPILEQPIQTAFPQVAVDGGIHFATNPILWVGDADSGKAPSSIQMKMKTSQDETDLRFCIREVWEWEWLELHLYGFLGKRKDHELANLGEVCQSIQARGKNSHAIFYDHHRPQILVYPSGKHAFSRVGLFSILCFEASKISIEGACVFSVKDQSLPAFSGRGVSNQGSGEIIVQSTSPFLVIFEEPK